MPPHGDQDVRRGLPWPPRGTWLSPVYSATEAREEAADAVSQSLSVLRLGLRLSVGKASRDSTLLTTGTKRTRMVTAQAPHPRLATGLCQATFSRAGLHPHARKTIGSGRRRPDDGRARWSAPVTSISLVEPPSARGGAPRAVCPGLRPEGAG